MPVRGEIEGRCLQVVLEGEHDLAAVRRVVEDALKDPRFTAPMRVRFDASRSRSNPPVSEIRDTIDFFLKIRDRFEPRWAVRVGDPLRYGLARMASAFADIHGLDISVEMVTAHELEAGEAAPTKPGE